MAPKYYSVVSVSNKVQCVNLAEIGRNIGNFELY